MSQTIDHSKFANTVLYLIRESAGGRPGLTKLLKLIYHADFNHYRKHLRSVTGLTYVAAERGPVPQGYQNHLDTLVSSGVISLDTVSVHGFEKPKSEYSTDRAPNLRIFTDSERETLDAVLAQYGGSTGKALSDITHLEGPWSWVWDPNDRGRPIPYLLGRWLDNRCDDGDLEQAVRLLGEPEVMKLISDLDKPAAAH